MTPLYRKAPHVPTGKTIAITPGMVDLLRMLRKGPIKDSAFSRSSAAPLGKLMDRGLAIVSAEGVWSITKSGLGMIVDDRRP